MQANNLFNFIEKAKKKLAEAEARAAELKEEISHLKYVLKLADEGVSDDEEGSSKLGPYTGMKLVDAAVAVLTAMLTPVRPKRLADLLLDGGYQTDSKNPHRTIVTTLQSHSRVAKIRKVAFENGKFTLPERLRARREPWHGPVPLSVPGSVEVFVHHNSDECSLGAAIIDRKKGTGDWSLCSECEVLNRRGR